MLRACVSMTHLIIGFIANLLHYCPVKNRRARPAETLRRCALTSRQGDNLAQPGQGERKFIGGTDSRSEAR